MLVESARVDQAFQFDKVSIVVVVNNFLRTHNNSGSHN